MLMIQRIVQITTPSLLVWLLLLQNIYYSSKKEKNACAVHLGVSIKVVVAGLEYLIGGSSP